MYFVRVRGDSEIVLGDTCTDMQCTPTNVQAFTRLCKLLTMTLVDAEQAESLTTLADISMTVVGFAKSIAIAGVDSATGAEMGNVKWTFFALPLGMCTGEVADNVSTACFPCELVPPWVSSSDTSNLDPLLKLSMRL